MKNSLYLLLLSFLIANSSLFSAVKRSSSSPYISGDTFRFNADFAYDEISKNLRPVEVTEGSTVFVKPECLKEFFTFIHPQIMHRYILITHNSDLPIPGKFPEKLDDEKIIAWFGQNVDEYHHEKLHPLPIGLANNHWAHGNTSLVSKSMMQKDKLSRNITLYMNFTFRSGRKQVFDLFRNEKYCTIKKKRKFADYLDDLCRSKFVLSPRGNGLDCHRTWEALYMGAIPIVKSSCIDSLFEDLPVVIVKEWKEVNLPFLNEQYKKLSTMNVNREKLYISYWLDLINSQRVER